MRKNTDWKRAQASATALGSALLLIGMMTWILGHETWLRAVGIAVVLCATIVLGAGIGIGVKSSRMRNEQTPDEPSGS